jgi:hypothetical protein
VFTFTKNELQLYNQLVATAAGGSGNTTTMFANVFNFGWLHGTIQTMIDNCFAGVFTVTDTTAFCPSSLMTPNKTITVN